MDGLLCNPDLVWLQSIQQQRPKENRFCVILATPFLIELEDILVLADQSTTIVAVDLWFRMDGVFLLVLRVERGTNRG